MDNNDLYYCVCKSMRSLDSILFRYGDEVSEYISSHPPEAFTSPKDFYTNTRGLYKIALARAKGFGLYADPNNLIK